VTISSPQVVIDSYHVVHHWASFHWYLWVHVSRWAHLFWKAFFNSPIFVTNLRCQEEFVSIAHQSGCWFIIVI